MLLQTKSEVVKIPKGDVQVLESGKDYARKRRLHTFGKSAGGAGAPQVRGH